MLESNLHGELVEHRHLVEVFQYWPACVEVVEVVVVVVVVMMARGW